MSRPFEPGDKVLLIDVKKRWYLITLKPGGEFHSHAGFINHDDLIGHDEGIVVKSTKGSRYDAFRPTLNGAYLLCWAATPPVRQVRAWLLARDGRELERHLFASG